MSLFLSPNLPSPNLYKFTKPLLWNSLLEYCDLRWQTHLVCYCWKEQAYWISVSTQPKISTTYREMQWLCTGYISQKMRTKTTTQPRPCSNLPFYDQFLKQNEISWKVKTCIIVLRTVACTDASNNKCIYIILSHKALKMYQPSPHLGKQITVIKEIKEAIFQNTFVNLLANAVYSLNNASRCRS